MPRICMIVEYDGTLFHGMQIQPDEVTVQGEIQKALFQIIKKDIAINFSGRTDTGVHALGQVIDFYLPEDSTIYIRDKDLTKRRLQMAMNHFLNRVGISVLSQKIVDEGFHSRYSAKERFYEYKIINRSPHSPLLLNRAWHCFYKLNIHLMQEACSYFIGDARDYSNFRTSGCQAKSAIKTVNSLSVQKDKDIITIDISAKSFLYNMVRSITGFLVSVGRGKISIDSIEDFFSKEKIPDARKFYEVAPAHGLYFKETRY